MYTTQSIRTAYAMYRIGLVRALERAGVCGPFSGWTRDELISVWLEHYGEKE